jgi:hypothetical protein
MKKKVIDIRANQPEPRPQPKRIVYRSLLTISIMDWAVIAIKFTFGVAIATVMFTSVPLFIMLLIGKL